MRCLAAFSNGLLVVVRVDSILDLCANRVDRLRWQRRATFAVLLKVVFQLVGHRDWSICCKIERELDIELSAFHHNLNPKLDYVVARSPCLLGLSWR